MKEDKLLMALMKAHALLLDPKKWSKGNGVINTSGCHCAAKDADAYKWDIFGAILKFTDVETAVRAQGVIRGIVREDIEAWEGMEQDHARMIFVFQVAILLAQGVPC